MSDYVDISTLDQLFPRLNYNLNVGIQFVAALCEKSSKLWYNVCCVASILSRWEMTDERWKSQDDMIHILQ